MAKVQSLTRSSIDNLKSGKLSDRTRPGLTIEGNGCGKIWRYYRSIARTGAAVKMTLGTFPAFTIADARQWADENSMRR